MRPEITHEGFEPSNREKNRQPKMGIYWCDGCDANLCPDWEKCAVCKYRNGIKRGKKDELL